MLKNIPVKINADKSITANYPYKIYQGEINTVRFIVDPSLVISDVSNVVGYIGFKRIDNQKSGFVPLKKETDGTFTYVIKDYWTLNLVGKVWYTIKFVSVSGDNQLEYQLYAGNSSFVVNPVADYMIGDDLPPDISSTLQLQIENLQEQINDTNANVDNKLNKEFNTYPKLDWYNVENSDIVALNRINQDGTVTQYYAEAEDLYNSVNNIRPDEDGNIELTGENINVSSTNNNTIDDEFDLKVNKNEPLVYYRDSTLPIEEPTLIVSQAEYANKAINDQNGNNIVATYSTINQVNELDYRLSDLTNRQSEIIYSGQLYSMPQGSVIQFNKPLKSGNVIKVEFTTLSLSMIFIVGQTTSSSCTSVGEIQGSYNCSNLLWSISYQTNESGEYISLTINKLTWLNYEINTSTNQISNISTTYPSYASPILADKIYLL